LDNKRKNIEKTQVGYSYYTANIKLLLRNSY